METLTAALKATALAVTEKRWLVLYTRARWEKKIQDKLSEQGIECYCPLKVVNHQWADRKKDVELPLFSCYLFVRVSRNQQEKALQTLGVLSYIHYMGRPAVVRDSIIENLKWQLSICKDAEIISLSGLSVGDRIKIKNGAMESKSGKVMQIQGKYVLMVIDNIDCALVTKVHIRDIDKQN